MNYLDKISDIKNIGVRKIIENNIIGLEITYINFSGLKITSIIEVNKRIELQTINVFNELLDIKFPINNVSVANGRTDRDIIIANDTTSFNYRKVAGKNVLSKHAFGLSIDLNPKNNPAKPSSMSEIYDESIEIGKINQDVINIFKNNGFKWGGEIFGNFKDNHHFEVDFNTREKLLNKLI